MTDTRVTCTDCANLQRGYCVKARAAGLSHQHRTEVGRDLATTPQNCCAYQPARKTTR